MDPPALIIGSETLVARVKIYRELISQSQHWSAKAANPRRCAGEQRSDTVKALARMHSTGRRLLLRMEFLLATGQDHLLTVNLARGMNHRDWDARFGDVFAAWCAERERQLAAPDAPALWKAALGLGQPLGRPQRQLQDLGESLGQLQGQGHEQGQLQGHGQPGFRV